MSERDNIKWPCKLKIERNYKNIRSYQSKADNYFSNKQEYILQDTKQPKYQDSKLKKQNKTKQNKTNKTNAPTFDFSETNNTIPVLLHYRH